MNRVICVEQAKDNTDILKVVAQGKEYHLNSVYRPVAEAERFAVQFENLTSDTILIVYGFGNGIFPRAIMKRCSQIRQVIFVEPCSEVLEKGNNIEDIVRLCETTKCILAADVKGASTLSQYIYPLSELYKVLQNTILYQDRKSVELCSLPRYEEIFVEEYHSFRHTVEYYFQQMQSNQQTASAIGHIAVENNIRILKYIPDSYCADSYVGVFPDDMPAIVVSAGPSLQKNLTLIQKAKEHALIVCVDTAVRHMLREDIIPDFIVSLDPRKQLELFDDDRIAQIPMIGVSDMSVNVLECVGSERIILASTENPFIQQLYHNAGHFITRLESGGSVATMAYSFCRYIGIHRIILVGQDLALTGRQMYIGQEEIELERFGRELIEIEDIYGKPVFTTRDYYQYLNWFEQMIRMHPETEIIDATEGGAKIQGTRIMTLDQALQQYARRHIRVEDYVYAVERAFPGTQREVCIKQIQKCQQQNKLIMNEMQEAVRYTEQGMKQRGDNATSKVASLRKRQMEKIEGFLNDFEQCDTYFLIMREIDATNLENYLDICEESKRMTDENYFDVMNRYFKCILGACEMIEHIIEEYGI